MQRNTKAALAAAALVATHAGCAWHHPTIAAEHLEILGLGQFDTWQAKGFAIGFMHLTWILHEGVTNVAPSVFWKVPAGMKYNATNELTR